MEATLPLSPVQNNPLYFLQLLVGSKKTWQHLGLNLSNSPQPSPASLWNLCSDKALSFLGITYISFSHLHAGLALFKIMVQKLVPLSITNSDDLSQWSEVNYEGHSFFADIICGSWPCSSLHSFIEIILRAYNMPCTVSWVGETEIKVYKPWILELLQSQWNRSTHNPTSLCNRYRC